MSDDFSPDIFWAATSKERVAICRKMAAAAESMASQRHDKRAEYLDLAERWYQLADEIERA
jgi:hypothetical protein